MRHDSLLVQLRIYRKQSVATVSLVDCVADRTDVGALARQQWQSLDGLLRGRKLILIFEVLETCFAVLEC